MSAVTRALECFGPFGATTTILTWVRTASIALLILGVAMIASSCAVTRYAYDPTTERMEVWTGRFIIKETKDLRVKSPTEWHLKSSSQPDPESIQMMREAFALGMQAAKAAAVPVAPAVLP